MQFLKVVEMQRKANCVCDGICQANTIKYHKNSLGTPDDINLLPWSGHSVPWKSTLVILWRKIKKGIWQTLPPQDCLPSSNPHMSIVEAFATDIRIPYEPLVHVMPPSNPNMTGSHSHLYLNLLPVDPPGSQWHHGQSSPKSHGSDYALSLAIVVAPSSEYQLITSLQSNLWHRPRSTPLCWCWASATEILMNYQSTSHCPLKHVVTISSNGSCCIAPQTKADTPSKGYQLMISHQSIQWEGRMHRHLYMW